MAEALPPLRPLDGLPPPAQAALAAEAGRLARLVAREAGIADVAGWLAANGLAPPEGVPPQAGPAAAGALGRSVGARPIAAMLAAPPDPETPGAARVDWLRGAALAAAVGFIRRSSTPETHDTVKRGLRPLRQLCAEPALRLHWPLLPGRPAAADAARSLASTLAAVEALAARLSQEGSAFGARLADLAALLRTHVARRPAWLVTGRAGRAPAPPPLSPLRPPGLEDAETRGARLVEPAQALGGAFRSAEEARDGGEEARYACAPTRRSTSALSCGS